SGSNSVRSSGCSQCVQRFSKLTPCCPIPGLRHDDRQGLDQIVPDAVIPTIAFNELIGLALAPLHKRTEPVVPHLDENGGLPTLDGLLEPRKDVDLHTFDVDLDELDLLV